MRHKLLLAGLLCLVACQRGEVLSELTFGPLYRATGIRLEGCAILPEFSEDPDDAASRAFYLGCDTALTFKAWRPSHVKLEHEIICALDWRITEIEVLTLSDYDATHPAGSSLADILTLEYRYKNRPLSIPLQELRYGTLMLADFYPYDLHFSFLYLRVPEQAPWPASLCVTLRNAFGQEFSASSGTSL